MSAAIDLSDRAEHGARRVVATMCIGVGMGIAMLLETVRCGADPGVGTGYGRGAR